MSSYIDVISQGNTAAAAGVKNEINSKTSMGKEDFLTLLVTQLQNQDPLNPDNPTEFTAQLAQFSSLEQLFTLNESMNDLVTSNAASDKFSSLNTIGKEVAYQSDSFNFSGESREIGYQLDSPATEITLELQQNGTTVATLQGTE
ncbi:MAG: flagellar hook assembly protein FlgD, partial [Deltaproteobacteria bacterium]|nr:flagellar hook assembly protein FlgD [Deltaproteobacteria bacterium]